MTNPTIRVVKEQDKIIVTFDEYGTKRYTIQAINGGLVVSVAHTRSDGKPTEATIGTVARDYNTIRVEAV
jgi:hypothetical protein